MAGNRLKDPETGLGAWDTLTKVIENKTPVSYSEGKNIYYKDLTDGPDGGKSLVLRGIIHRFRERAKRIILDPETSPFKGIARAALQKKIERKRILMPADETISIGGGQ